MSEIDKFLVARLDNAEEELRDLKRDYSALKDTFNELQVEHAKAMERQGNIISRLDKLDGGLSKLFWLVAGASVSFVMVWVFNGGLTIPGN